MSNDNDDVAKHETYSGGGGQRDLDMSLPATHEGIAQFRKYQTWYRITGDLADGKKPLIVLHGGPGCTHDYVKSFSLLATDGWPVIHYDQLGNGNSTRLPEKGADFWTVDLFLEELDNLIDHLGIQNGYHLLGQSWGGMLGAEHAVRQPEGLCSLVIANSPASMALWVAEADRLRQELPTDVQTTLLQHEHDNTTDSEEYANAVRVFYDRHVCRVTPWPDDVKRTFDAIDADPTVYHAMNGPSEFHVIGTMRDWTIVDRLDRIDVPTLLISGRYDEATSKVVQQYADHVRNVRWEIFDKSSHMPHVEEMQRCMQLTSEFLDQYD